MKIMIKYRGYIGHFFFDEKNAMFQGNVANTHDLITFQGKSVESTRQAFQDAIDEYIAWCKKVGKPPEKPFPIESLS